MKPLALDLFKGLGGATRGLKAAGFFVIGIDNEDYSTMEGYVAPDAFIQADIREVAKDVRKYLLALQVDFVWASPPCQEFSYESFPFKRCRDKAALHAADKSLWESAVKIAADLNAPIVIENVRGAEKYFGKAKAHYGSFYLWYDVPFMLPMGRPVKGFQEVKVGGTRNGLQRSGGLLNQKRGYKKMFGSEKYSSSNRFENHPGAQMGSQSQSRKEWSALAAMIPEELSTWIGEVFMRDCLEKYDNVPCRTEGGTA